MRTCRRAWLWPYHAFYVDLFMLLGGLFFISPLLLNKVVILSRERNFKIHAFNS